MYSSTQANPQAAEIIHKVYQEE